MGERSLVVPDLEVRERESAVRVVDVAPARRQAQRAFVPRDRRLGRSLAAQRPGERVRRDRRARVPFERLVEHRQRRRVLVRQRERAAHREVRAERLGRELESAVGGLARASGHVAQVVDEPEVHRRRVAERESRPRGIGSPVERDRLLEERHRFPIGGPGLEREAMLGALAQLPDGDRVGAAARRAHLVEAQHGGLELADQLRDQLLLEPGDLPDVTLVAIRPDVLAALRLTAANRDGERHAVAEQRALDEVAGPELLARVGIARQRDHGVGLDDGEPAARAGVRGEIGEQAAREPVRLARRAERLEGQQGEHRPLAEARHARRSGRRDAATDLELYEQPDRLGAVRDVERRDHRRDVLLDRAEPDPEHAGDVRVGEPARDQLQDFELPMRQGRRHRDHIGGPPGTASWFATENPNRV